METENKRKLQGSGFSNDKFWTGLVLVIVGAVLFADKLGMDFPRWLFKWPMILILVGIVSGFKHRFRNISWIIMIAIGGFFLADELIVSWDFRHYFWPILIMGVGVLFILRPKRKWFAEGRTERWQKYSNTTFNPNYENTSAEDIINSTSIFGGVKKVVTSKSFKGGEIICIMGGAEYNLTQADFSGTIYIEIIQAFGGTKLIVPSHWEIRTEIVAIFAGIEDKRPTQPGTFDPTKILVLKGTTIFGGVEIKSY